MSDEQQWSRGGKQAVLTTYVNLHRGKLGAHWLWCVIERIAAGASEAEAFAEYGYRLASAQEPQAACESEAECQWHPWCKHKCLRAATAPSAPAAPVVTADAVRDALTIALDGLDEIALAGMSGTGMESEEGMRDWHARQAWKFIGIAARTKEAARAAMHSTDAREEVSNATGTAANQTEGK